MNVFENKMPPDATRWQIINNVKCKVMENLTHWKKLTNPDYIGAYSLQPGEEKTVEIVSVGKRMVKGTDGKESECIVADLKGEKPFILNKTNCKTLTKLFKTPFIENWKGKRVIVYAAKVKAFGEEVDALRIRPTEPLLPELNPNSPKWAGALDAMKKGATTIEAIKKAYAVSLENEKLLIAAIPQPQTL